MNTVIDARGQRLHGSCDLPDSPLAPSAARRWVSAMLASWNLRPSADDEATIVQLTSELVTNAIQHAAAPASGGRGFKIELVAEDGALRLEVHDPDPAMPKPRAPDFVAECGRGLLLVEAQAQQWGAVPYEGGKYVWFSVEWPGGAGHPSAAPTPGPISPVSSPAPSSASKENPVCPPSPCPTTPAVPARTA